MPRPVAMPIANDKRRRPLRKEAIRILKPAISNIPKSVSATVAAHATDTANERGKSDVTAPVYSTKRAKFPQDTFFAPYGPHKPKRSATADRKEAPSANRANRRTISVPFSLSCAAFEFIPASGYGNFFSSHNGLRLVSVLLPLSEQRELVLCPIGSAGWHGRRVVFVGRKCSKHFVSMVRIRHEGVVIQVYLVTLHVRNIDGAKQWLDVTRE